MQDIKNAQYNREFTTSFIVIIRKIDVTMVSFVIALCYDGCRKTNGAFLFFTYHT